MAGQMSMKRIQREILDLAKEDLGEIVLAPTDKSVYEWKAIIPGPGGSPYAGGLFHLSISLPNDYPFSAPKVVFTTPLYHPNVSPHGQICVDVLKNAWSPALSLYKVMLSLSSLLTDPNPNDPLVPTIAQEYVKNRALFDQKAREWTAKHAMPKARAPKKQANIPHPPQMNVQSSSNTRAPTGSSFSGSGLLASIMSFSGRRPQPAPVPMPQPMVQQGPTSGRHSSRTTRQSRNSVQALLAHPQSSVNGTISPGNIIDLDDDDDDTYNSISNSRTHSESSINRKRKREEEPNGESSRPSRRRNPSSRIGGEIIVIDDD